MIGTRSPHWIVLGLVLGIGDVGATPVTDSVQDVTVIQDGSGSSRILFRPGPVVAGLAETSISSAVLTLTTGGLPASRGLRLRIYPVTAAWSASTATWTAGWSRAGGDYDEEIFADAEVDFIRGTATAAFDVTGILKEMLETGMAADGLLLTVHPIDGVGIPVADLSRFGTLATAAFDVTYRKAPLLRAAPVP